MSQAPERTQTPAQYASIVPWTDEVLALVQSHHMDLELRRAVEDLRQQIISTLARAEASSWTNEQLLERLPSGERVMLIVHHVRRWMARTGRTYQWIPDPDEVFRSHNHRTAHGRQPAGIDAGGVPTIFGDADETQTDGIHANASGQYSLGRRTALLHGIDRNAFIARERRTVSNLRRGETVLGALGFSGDRQFKGGRNCNRI